MAHSVIELCQPLCHNKAVINERKSMLTLEWFFQPAWIIGGNRYLLFSDDCTHCRVLSPLLRIWNYITSFKRLFMEIQPNVITFRYPAFLAYELEHVAKLNGYLSDKLFKKLIHVSENFPWILENYYSLTICHKCHLTTDMYFVCVCVCVFMCMHGDKIPPKTCDIL